MDSAKVTIAIPTYNRRDTIQTNIASIVDSLPEWVEILICDNASEPAVEFEPEVWRIAKARRVEMRVHRNPVNLGAAANILRLFELVETEWLLLLGDDDPLIPEALDQIAECVSRHQGCPIFKFSSPYGSYATEMEARNFDEFMEKGSNFNHLLFMSTYLFDVRECLPYLRFGYLTAPAAAAHLAIAAMASMAGKPIVLSPLFITRARQAEPAWSPADVRLNFYHLADLPLTLHQRRLLRAKIYAGHNIFREFLDIASIQKPQPDEAAYIRQKALNVHRVHGHGLKRWAARLLLPLSRIAGQHLVGRLKMLYARSKGQAYQHIFTSRHDRL